MKKKITGLVLCALLFALCWSAGAQQTTKIPKIAYLATASSEASGALVEAFRQGLRAHGWVEGQNITIEYRYAEGNPDRLREHAGELLRSNVDVILVNGAGPARGRHGGN